MTARVSHIRQQSSASVVSSIQTPSNEYGDPVSANIIGDHWSRVSTDDISMQYLIFDGASKKANSRSINYPPAYVSLPYDPIRSRTTRNQRCGLVRGWSVELLGLAIAACIPAAIIVLLRHYKGKFLADTPSRPSLNAIINILSTVLTALILLSTTAGKYERSFQAYIPDLLAALSQSKWTRFGDPRPMEHLRLIDAASRGPRGAVLVLLHPKLGCV